MATAKNASNKITTLAFKALREAHPEEYEAAKVAAAAELGVEYKRRKSQDEKDRETLATLLKENPGLRSELFAQVEQQIVEGQASATATSVSAKPALGADGFSS